MDNFAFVLHPIDARTDVARKFKLLKYFPEAFIHFISLYFPAFYLSHITGIHSVANGRLIEGWFVGCPLTPRRMMAIPVKNAYHKIIQAGRLAQRLGARILGLGAFTSSVGDAGITIARQLNMPVTTGNTYTVSATLQAVFDAARQKGYRITDATAAVVGATGSIGQACAKKLGPLVSELTLIGRSADRVATIAREVDRYGARRVRTATRVDALVDAQLIVATTNAGRGFIESRHLSSGAIVCDVARPFNVTDHVRRTRKDVWVINGGMIEVPGDVDFHFDFGLPPRMAFACMSETMILALEGRYENYTLGRDISVDQVDEMAHLADQHGFKVRLNQ